MLIIMGKCEKLLLHHPLSQLMSKRLNVSDSVDLKKWFHHQNIKKSLPTTQGEVWKVDEQVEEGCSAMQNIMSL